jgi:hypothetical protein
MERFFFETDEAALRAVAVLKEMGGQARNLLSECIEHQGIKRKKVSAVAQSLENAGFVFIKDNGTLWTEEIEIIPSMMGEEAMELYEESLALETPSSSPEF